MQSTFGERVCDEFQPNESLPIAPSGEALKAATLEFAPIWIFGAAGIALSIADRDNSRCIMWNSTPPQRMQHARGPWEATDITIPHAHSMTGIGLAPRKVAADFASKRDASAMRLHNFIYTRDKLPCKEMAEKAGQPCGITRGMG
jgi:hypothetical protein